jgi:zinc protease
MEPTYNDHRDPYLFGVLLRVKDAKDLRAVEKAVLKDVGALASGRVDAKRVEAVRSNLKYSAIMALDKADSVAVTLAVTTAQTGDTEFLNKEYAIIEQLKPADLSDFAKKNMLDINRTTTTLTTAKGGAR